jgi:hypothetical protein
MNTPALQRLHAPLPNLAAWVARFRAMPIPVMAGTAAAIDELIDHERSMRTPSPSRSAPTR